MKPFYHFLLTLILVMLAGCSVIAGIFEAGIWVGMIMIVIFIALITLVISKLGSKS